MSYHIFYRRSVLVKWIPNKISSFQLDPQIRQTNKHFKTIEFDFQGR